MDSADLREDRRGETAPDDRSMLRDSTAHLLHRAHQFVAEHFSQLANASEDELTLRQYELLGALSTDMAVSQTHLVKKTGIDRSTLAEMVKRLTERGFILRSTSPDDRRAMNVTLSPRGADALQRSMPLVRRADMALLEVLPKGRRKAFLETLRLLVEAADLLDQGLDPRVRKGRKKKPVLKVKRPKAPKAERKRAVPSDQLTVISIEPPIVAIPPTKTKARKPKKQK